MAATCGESLPAIDERLDFARLREHPEEFSFFQAVRLLQLLAPGRPTIGGFTAPRAEPVRLATSPSLSFPPSEIRSLEESGGRPPKMTVNFFGLDGALGVLPTRYTETVLERLYAGDTTLRDFLDLLNHRMISLLYRAWEKYRFPVTYERERQDRFTGYLFDLIGLGSKGLEDRQPIADQSLVYYTGLLAQCPRSATAFRLILCHFFQVPVEIVEFAGAWRRLDASSQTQLNEGFSSTEQLGIGMALGDEVWDQQSVVRVRLGPLTRAQYAEFLPAGRAHGPLKAVARFFCGCDLDVELQLVLQREEAPRFGLGDGTAPKLGWTSWIFASPLDRDPDETVIRLWER
ncbi:MAG TPA: type VI secretion system baseplate subunit TssG [Bryobacteraceae bacterium]|nr:type VI secretion system baseplate subunit TssG [Bryobacteraceae bacterium]